MALHLQEIHLVLKLKKDLFEHRFSFSSQGLVTDAENKNFKYDLNIPLLLKHLPFGIDIINYSSKNNTMVLD